MSRRTVRAARFAVAVPAALLALWGGFALWVRPDTGHDIGARLPDGLEAVLRVPRVADAADLLERLSGADAGMLRRRAWYGEFGGAAVGLRGHDVVAVLEGPKAAALGPYEVAVADALGLDKRPGGAYEIEGRRVWMSSRGRFLYFATSQGLLAEALECAGRSRPALSDPGPTLRDSGLLARLDREQREGRLNDLERWLHGRLRGLACTADVRFIPDGVELSGRAPRDYPTGAIAARAAVARRPRPARLAALHVPGLALRHVETFSAPHVWDEIVHDPDNRRFVAAFNREIEDYERFLNGRDFESELLPRLGPERALAVAHVDWKAFGVRPKSPLPAVLLMVEVRGIEAEVLKSLDRFLGEAEAEGKRYDLPAPRGQAAPVLDPFRHVEQTVDGVRLVRIVFREGVSDFGSEFSPGYAVIDGVLCVTTFWPILPKLGRTAAEAGLAGHRTVVVEGAEARRVLLENAGEVAELGATWRLLDRLAPEADRDFERIYGRAPDWKPPILEPFTQLEAELRAERPDLMGEAFDRELDERLEAWIAGEKRALAARRAEPLKKGEEFVREVASRRGEFEGWVRAFRRVERVEWAAEGDLAKGELRWALRVRID